MNIEQLIALVTRKSGQPPQAQDNFVLDELLNTTAHPDVRQYLYYCLPFKTYLASEMRVLSLESILMEMGESSVPGSFLRPFGYLIIATSVGGNAVCVHQDSGRVFWADHDSFSDDTITFKNRATGEWKYLYEDSPENVESAMVPLSQTLENFMNDLLTDQLSTKLDALD
jgi:hypothetical protein